MADKLTSSGKIITLAFEDPKLKLWLTKELVQIIVPKTFVMYVDLDLQFSSLLQNLDETAYAQFQNSGRLVVLQPPDDILEFVNSLALQERRGGGVLFLDSLNSLQNILTEDTSRTEGKRANQKTALLISVLQIISRSYGMTLVLINVAKSRPRSSGEKYSSAQWEKKLVGGRMIRFKSDSIISVREIRDNRPLVEVTIEDSGLSEEAEIAGRERKFAIRI